jgi:hypothetical protein
VDVALELPFADGCYRFDLKLPQIFELQEKTGKGLFAIYAEVMAGRGYIGDDPVGNPFEAMADYRCVREIIRLGLIGGGSGMVDGEEVEVGPNTARTLVERYIDPRPLTEGWDLASAIIHARVVGFEPKKKAQTESEPSLATGSSAPPS